MLEYHQAKLDYLRCFAVRKQQTSLLPATLKRFSDPAKADGYNDRPITDDLITDIYLGFSKQTRCDESQEYLRTLTGGNILFLFSQMTYTLHSDLFVAR
jgi:hypothetical protein